MLTEKQIEEYEQETILQMRSGTPLIEVSCFDLLQMISEIKSLRKTWEKCEAKIAELRESGKN